MPPTARSCWPRSTSTQTRASARRSVCRASRPCSPSVTVRSSTPSSAPIPEHEVQRFVDSLLPTEAESEVSALVAKGDETSLRQALELEPGNEDAVVGARRPARRPRRRRRGAGVARADPGVRADAPRRRRRPPRIGTRRLRRHARQPAAAGEGRRRRPPAVRRHPRADGPRRPAHRRVPPPPHGPRCSDASALAPPGTRSVAHTDIPRSRARPGAPTRGGRRGPRSRPRTARPTTRQPLGGARPNGSDRGSTGSASAASSRLRRPCCSWSSADGGCCVRPTRPTEAGLPVATAPTSLDDHDGVAARPDVHDRRRASWWSTSPAPSPGRACTSCRPAHVCTLRSTPRAVRSPRRPPAR